MTQEHDKIMRDILANSPDFVAKMNQSNIPPAGPITDTVDMHLTKAGGVFAVELFSMARDDDGQETTEDSIGEVRIEADDSVREGYDMWFSYRQYLEDRDVSGYSARLTTMLDMAGQLGLSLVGGGAA